MLLELYSGVPLRHSHQGPHAKEQGFFFLMTKRNDMYDSAEVKTHYQDTCILVSPLCDADKLRIHSLP